MSLLTLELIGLLLAAWKAPNWVKETGVLAMVTGILGFLVGFWGITGAAEQAGDVPGWLLLVGLRVASIALIYGILIYAASLIIRIVQKPRLL